VPALARSDRLTVALGVILAVTALYVFLGAGGIARPATAPALVAAIAFAATLSLGAGLRLAGVQAERPVLWMYDLVVAALAAVLLFDLLQARWPEAVLRGLVVDLGALRGPATLQERIARAIGDPTIRVGTWDSASGIYADETGVPVSLPIDGSGLATTLIDDDGVPLAVLVHDSAALGDKALLASVAALARTAVANASLEAQIEEQTREIAASRRRLVEAADGERRALQRTLVQGPERRLRTVSELVAQAASSRTATDGHLLQREIDAATDELRDLADGVRPADLDGGLGRALPALAARSPLDVSTVANVGRLPDAVEAAAYFVCSEALANAAKHAKATSARIEATTDSRRLQLTVADDGGGGANVDGAGLRGLADRVEALGGWLRVESPPGTGTRVLAEIPLTVRAD
jgi:signal transduction histidine kinase